MKLLKLPSPLTLLITFSLPLLAAEPDLSEQLRKALYTEEVERDTKKSAEQYQSLLKQFDLQRPVAASALFRLAEILRQQKENKKAVTLYQRLLREFPEFERENDLARKRLADLGVERGITPEAPSTRLSLIADSDLVHLRYLKNLGITSPDLMTKADTLHHAIKENYLGCVKFLLNDAKNLGNWQTFQIAAQTGNILICRALLESPIASNEFLDNGMSGAIYAKHGTILQLFLDSGKVPCLEKALSLCLREKDIRLARMIIESGADPTGRDERGKILEKLLAISSNQVDTSQVDTSILVAIKKLTPASRKLLENGFYSTILRTTPYRVCLLSLQTGKLQPALSRSNFNSNKPELSSLLLAHLPLILEGLPPSKSFPPVKIRRRDKSGSWTSLRVDLESNKPLPRLLLGDVITTGLVPNVTPVKAPLIGDPKQVSERLKDRLKSRLEEIEKEVSR